MILFLHSDDRYIVQEATANNGIVVSNDQFRDIWHEGDRGMKETIEKRLEIIH